MVRFSISLLNDGKVSSFIKTGKHRADVTLDSSLMKKNELSVEVVNVGQRPLFVKSVRLVVPCPETDDSDSVTFRAAQASQASTPIQPGAASVYKAGEAWNLSDHPLIGERFCVIVESNKGFVAQTDEVSDLTFSVTERLKPTTAPETQHDQ